MTSQPLYNSILVSDNLLTSGQPTPEQLESLAAQGFSTVINLATTHSTNALANEEELVHSLGMTYYHIPVEWEAPQENDFAAFDRVMAQLPSGKTLLHCAANFRVTAFYSLYAQKHLGWSGAQAADFRAAIWDGSDYPVWQAFITRLEAQIAAQRSAPDASPAGGE